MLPWVSTDAARIGLRIHGSTNDVSWSFSRTFAIRPDARVGDAAPQVAVTAPAAGQSYTAGAVVPVSWAASDDEGIRSFDVQASYDTGRTWHLLALGLPASTTSFAWRTPAGQGLGGVLLRVVARDLEFQNSSASTLVVSVGSAPTPPPPAQTDTVAVTKAEYRTQKKTLTIEATSTRSDATLTVSVTATGQTIGSLANAGGGRYLGTFTWGSAPQQVTVRSNKGSSATATVSVRK